MNEAEARQRIVAWAKDHFSEEHIIPDVKVLSIEYNEDEDEWSAELLVSTSAENPFVTFFEDSTSQLGVQVRSVEY
jgi:hypothetical protein